MLRLIKPLLAAGLIIYSAQMAVAQDRPRIVAVNHALQYFAQRLIGDAGDVVFPVPRDVDPSFWRPSIADISMVQSADLVLLNGAGFASWIDRVSLSRAKLVNTSADIEDQFIMTESITHSHGDGGEHSHEGVASYVWLDPTLAAAQAEAIAAAITARGLVSEADAQARLAALRADLDALDDAAKAMRADLQDVTLIATHPRYEYFADRYDLSITSLEWDAGAMPTEADISDLKSRITETGAQVLIWEATPPAGAFEMTSALGLQNIVFPPLAQPVVGRTYTEVFEEAIFGLSEALDQ
ncbi:metal ABC transporter solute-binding protein, Zn/Mn family [Sulfitobacter sp. S190]|uniref:metal ABC transporter substrate-binding protein n=1 Tax=Sulfitobacter sp. S190 TaxID=2867022 RepID=UPI0021A7A63C|nr:zinc ABC transporter substrate-binding protein [Sulfitobacter sp. S190]UWR21800.1 zinc ABC transporter substrate-binding protein [Sulfitobacter sp. S190]